MGSRYLNNFISGYLTYCTYLPPYLYLQYLLTFGMDIARLREQQSGASSFEPTMKAAPKGDSCPREPPSPLSQQPVNTPLERRSQELTRRRSGVAPTG